MFPDTGCKIGTAYNTMYYMSWHFGYKNGIITRIKRKVANYATVVLKLLETYRGFSSCLRASF